MNPTQYAQAKGYLLAAAMQVAPNGRTQQAFANLLTQLELDGNSAETILSRMASAIIDGLEYGNWPE